MPNSSIRSLELLLLAAPLALASGEARGDRSWSYPAVSGHGKVVAMPDAALQPSPKAHYELVLDVTGEPDSAGQVNPSLDKVARVLNTFAAGGVPPEKMDVVAVVHGKATWSVLENGVYRAKRGAANPNLDLLSKLRRHGVRLYVCGQALAHRGLSPEQVAAPVETALAATVALAELQRRGYEKLSM